MRGENCQIVCCSSKTALNDGGGGGNASPVLRLG